MVPRDARALPLRAAAAEGELQRRGGRAERHPAARPRREPPLLRQRGGAGGRETPTGRSASRTSRSSPGVREAAREDLAHGRARAHAARGGRAGAGRHRAGGRAGGRASRRRVHRRAARRAAHPGRDEPVQRLLRRAARRRHRGPPRARCASPPGASCPRGRCSSRRTHLRPGRALRGLPRRRWPAGELLVVGVLSIAAGVLYTGGPRPYGYEGLGEIFVFLFFGVAAVAGSTFAQIESWPWEAFVLAVPVGLLAAAILVVNNVRDIETDRRAGKRTLAVRLGRERARTLYGVMIYGAFAVAPLPWLGRILVTVAARLLARAAAGACRSCAPCARTPTARRSTRPWPGTGMLQLAFCLLLSAGILAELRSAGRARRDQSPGRCASARPCAPPSGVLRERELLELEIEGADGLVGRGEAAPLEPYDGVSARPCCARLWRRYARRARGRATSGRRRAAGRVPRRGRPAPGAGRGRPRAVGPRRPARGAARGCAARRPPARRRCPSTPRSARTDRAAGPPPPPRPRAAGFALREDQGRRR